MVSASRTDLMARALSEGVQPAICAAILLVFGAVPKCGNPEYDGFL